MRTWIERIPLSENFAGREGNSLDRIKAMKALGWELTVLTVDKADHVILLGWCSESRREAPPQTDGT